MNDKDYTSATSRTDPEGNYTPEGEVAKRLVKNAAALHYAMGLSTEANEVLDALKAHIYYGKPLDTVNLIEEVGDIQWYEARLLSLLGSSFAYARTANILKLMKRYPDGFTEEDATVRDLEAERGALTMDHISLNKDGSLELGGYLGRKQQDGFDETPAHYDNGRETIDVIRDSMCDIEFAGFCRGNAIKYEQRAGKKGDPSGDAEKARWYRAMAAHVCGYGEDPRAGRDQWNDDLNGYHRTTAAAVPLAAVDDINDLAHWIWPDLHPVDGRLSKLVSVFEAVLRKDNRMTDIGVAVCLHVASDGADAVQDILNHATPAELTEHLEDLDASRLGCAATVDEIMEIIDRTKLYGDDDPVARVRRVIGYLKNERDISRKLLLRARHALDEWTREGVVDEGLLKSIERHLDA